MHEYYVLTLWGPYVSLNDPLGIHKEVHAFSYSVLGQSTPCGPPGTSENFRLVNFFRDLKGTQEEARNNVFQIVF